jgi:hypothetical protein
VIGATQLRNWELAPSIYLLSCISIRGGTYQGRAAGIAPAIDALDAVFDGGGSIGGISGYECEAKGGLEVCW